MRASTILVVILALLLAGCGGEQSGQSSDPGSRPADSDSDSRSANSGGETADRGEQIGRTTGASGGETTGAGLRTVTIEASGGESVEVRVEIVDDVFEQARGLMERTALGEDRGMLFVYGAEQEQSFWMRNTLIPLSIAYMDSEGRIVDIQDMKPLDDDPPHYVSAKPAQYALEVNKGFFDERGVEVGDRAELPG